MIGIDRVSLSGRAPRNMKRRTFIGISVSLSGLSLLSGCTGALGGNQIQDSDGDGMIDSKDYAPNDAAVQEKSDIAGASSDSNSAESTTPESQSNTPKNSNKEEREKILKAYNDGIGLLNKGTKRLDSAISAFNEDRLDDAISSSDGAIPKFEDAEGKFSTAVNTALRIGHSDATELSQDAQEYALHMQLAAQYSSMAADAAKKGNTEQANEFIQRHRNEYQAAQKIGVRDPPVLRDVLKL